MKCPINRKYWVPLCWIAGAMALVGGQAEVDADLAAVEAIRDASLEQAVKPLTDLRAKYRDALEKRRLAAQSAGDLKGVLAFKGEAERLETDDGGGAARSNPEVERLRQAYLQEKAKLQPQMDARVLEVERAHARSLENLVAELTKAGRLLDAKMVSERKDAFVAGFQSRRQAGSPVGKSGLLQGRTAGEKQQVEIAPGTVVTFCWIPPGTFMMGEREGEPGYSGKAPAHKVRLTKGFWMARTETTTEQWEAVMGSRPSFHQGRDLPVEQVSWLDVCGTPTRTGGFMAKINEAAPNGWRFDLPTEAEWEFACRAGTTTTLSSGQEITGAAGVCDRLDKLGWYNENSGGKTHPVAGKSPNPWGLCDMHGNVWEWTADWSGSYPVDSVTDPAGPDSGGSRIIRSGSWSHNASNARADHRNDFKPYWHYRTVGFRLILRQSPTPVGG